jgi:hypothetical protein
MTNWEEGVTTMRRGFSYTSINSASAASEGERVVFHAKPLFAHPRTTLSMAVDTLTWIWAFICHCVITAWPYLSLVLMAGAFSSNLES